MAKQRQCELCKINYSGIPLLICGHFICPPCYVKLKNIDSKCKCPFCDKKLQRRLR